MDALSVITEYEITPFRGSSERLRDLAVLFTGAMRASGQPNKLLLLNDPASAQSFFYEFRAEDVLYVEESPNLVQPDGSMIPVVRLWVKKGALALRVEPFVVADTAQGLREFR